MTEEKIGMAVARYYVYNAFRQSKKKKLTTLEMMQLAPDEAKDLVSKGASNMKSAGFLDSEKVESIRVCYFLTAKGKAIFNTLKNYEPVESPPRKPYTRKSKQMGMTLNSAPAPAPLNISKSAEALAGDLSAVFAENEAYRNLMKQVYDLIGKTLGLNEEKTDGSS